MKLEIGKYYRTRLGKKVGPIEWNSKVGAFQGYVVVSGECKYYYKSGKQAFDEHDLDLVSEWRERVPLPPSVKPFVRWSVKPDTYGKLKVCASDKDSVTLQIGGTQFNWEDLSVLKEQIEQLMEILEEGGGG